MVPAGEPRRRPRSVTIIALLAILYGVLTLAHKAFVLLSPATLSMTRDLFAGLNASAPVPLPFAAHMAHGLTGSVVLIVAGGFMLRGFNWARLLLLLWPLTALALTFAVYGLSASLGLKTLTYLVLAFFLLRGPSAQYFGARPAHDRVDPATG